ncbi:MAG: M28 family peptidase [Bacteriovoracaceae bacterium]|nr:M28 family peptidase [Bacteriovoracaceae bacterium]
MFSKILYIVLFATICNAYAFVDVTYFVDTINYLANVKLEGRQSATQGDYLAQKYIIDKLVEQKVSPLPAYPSYKQTFSIFKEMEKDGANYLSVQTQNLFVPFEPLPLSDSGVITGLDLVFVGHGITYENENFKYDDYQGIDVEGKVVVVVAGDPSTNNPNSPFNNSSLNHLKMLPFKLKNAIFHKAKGFLYLSNPLNYDQQNEPALVFLGHEGAGQHYSILAGQIKVSWFDGLVPNVDLRDHLQKIANTQAPHSFIVENYKTTMEVNLKKITGKTSNIIGFIPGSDPTLSKEIVAIGAHLDHLGYGGTLSMGFSQVIHPGADDNASGCALLLALSKYLVSRDHRRSYLITFFNAEEHGLIGSKHLMDQWPRLASKYGKIVSMINFDMVGRYVDKLNVAEAGSAIEWRSLLNDYTSNNDSEITLAINDQAINSSDHVNFKINKIPTLFFFTDVHKDYHRPTDTPEKINYLALTNMNKFMGNFADHLDALSAPTFNPDHLNGSGRVDLPVGERASLGCLPDFGGGDIEGVRCTMIIPNSPAQIAGLIDGDILVKMGDIAISNLYDLTFALKYYHAGDEVGLSYIRSDNVITQTTVKLTARN